MGIEKYGKQGDLTMKIGDKVYRNKDYGRDVAIITEIVGETKKYYKLKNGILIEKDSGRERGTSDAMYPRHYHIITSTNESEIMVSYKYFLVKNLKRTMADMAMNEMESEYTPDKIDRLYDLLNEAVEIIQSGKKIK